jgi:hypothetical protein
LPAAAGGDRMGDRQLLQRNSIVNALTFEKEKLDMVFYFIPSIAGSAINLCFHSPSRRTRY